MNIEQADVLSVAVAGADAALDRDLEQWHDRVRWLRDGGDRGDAPPEMLLVAAIVSGAAATTTWLISGWLGSSPWAAIMVGACAALTLVGYLLIKARNAVRCTRRRRAAETGE
jgi:hypothetical protein